MNHKTLGVQGPKPPLNDAPDRKARSYSLALCGLDVGAWRRHPNAVDRSENLHNLYWAMYGFVLFTKTYTFVV